MSWGFVAVAGASLVGSAVSANASKRAGNAAARGADAATNESARQYDQTRDDLASGRSLYNSSNNALARLFGFGMPATEGEFDEVAYLRDNPDVAADKYWGANPEDHYLNFGMREGRARPSSGGTPELAAGSPDLSSFFTSPDYEFRRTEGTRGIERSAAAAGGAFSGNALRALNEYNSNLASSEFGDYFNRLATMSGIGQTATNQTAAYGAEHAGNAGRNALAAGEARASGIIGQGNAIGQGISDIAGAYGYYQGNRRVPGGYGGTGYGGRNWTTPGYGDGMRYG